MGSNRRSRSRERRRSSKRRRHRSTSSGSSSTTLSDVSYEHTHRKHKKAKRRSYKRRNHSKHSNLKTNKRPSAYSNVGSHSQSRPCTPPLPLQFTSTAAPNNNINNQVGRNSSTMTINSGTGPQLGDSASNHNTQNFSLPVHTFTSHINVVPEFDPNDGSQGIELWIHKVNECAKIYGWNDVQTCHYSLAKLAGLAKRWYQGLPSVLYTWQQWTEKLKGAFPSTENYGDVLQRMLQLRCKLGQALDVYYYEKMILINKCEITGRKAVGCLIHGIDDKFIRMSSNSCRFEEPEQLFAYLKTIAQNDHYQNQKRRPVWNKDPKPINISTTVPSDSSKPEIICFNCGEPGHIRTRCTKPTKKCNNCRRVGHVASECRSGTYTNASASTNANSNLLAITETSGEKTVMNIRPENTNLRIQSEASETDKYYKIIEIDRTSKRAFIDLGSNCSLIKESIAKQIYGELKTDVDLPTLRGFGNSSVKPLATVSGLVKIDEVEAQIDLVVVADQFMPNDLIIGQTFTELPNLIMYKTSKDLMFYTGPSPECNESNSKFKLIISNGTEIEPNSTSPIDVVSVNNVNGSLYVPAGFYHFKGYIVLPGLYNFYDSIGYIMIANVSPKNLHFDKGDTLARGVAYNEIIDAQVNLTSMSRDENSEKLPLPLEDITIGTQLSKAELNQTHELLRKYRDCFALDLSELGKTNITEMTIKLKDNTPVVYNPYRMSYKEKEQLSVIIDDLLKNGIIRESSSSYASPILLVNKKNGQKRLCVDYRALNRCTLKDKYPLPRIEDKLDCLGGNNYFSSLDLASGYYQVPVAEECKHLTAFVTPDGLYEYNRMPFGLANAPSVFQRLMNTMLSRAGQTLAMAYMDDLLVPSKTVQEGLEKLEKVFILLRQAKLTLNLRKCVFFRERIDYLGFEISREGIRPGAHKIDAVKQFPVPKNVHEVRQFVGLTSYFRKFVPNFSRIARPLTVLTKKSESWRFGTEQMTAFETLKGILADRPVLALYDPRARLEVHTDASKFGIGAILMQDGGKGLQPIAYYSRQTSPEEQKFHSYELETLAVITALNRFRVYLLGATFKLVTDCSAIRCTMTKKDLVPRVARWWIAMQEYDFTIEYRAGAKMAHVDALSRNPIDSTDPSFRDDDVNIFRIDSENVDSIGTDERWLQTIQQADGELRRIVEILKDTESNNVLEIKNNFTYKNDKLYRVVKKDDEVNLLWVVPKSVRWQILKSNHDNVGHFGYDKTYNRIRKVYWFKNMRRFIKKYCKSCLHCAFNKVPGGPKEGMLHSIPKSDKPFDTLHADHCGPFPVSKKQNCYILAIIDAFTKFIYIKPVKNCKTKMSILVFDEYFSLFGVPRRLITDRGTSFTSHSFEQFTKDKGIIHVLNAVATPRANGQIERYNRSIMDSLTATNEGFPDNEWDLKIPQVQWALNNTINKATGKSPSELLFGVTPTGVSDGPLNAVVAEANKYIDRTQVRADAKEKILEEQKKQKERFDKRRKEAKSYAIGDLVRVERDIGNPVPGQSRKLLHKCSGPYRVVRCLGNDRYEIEDSPITKRPGKPTYRAVFAVDKIHPWLVFSGDPMESDSDAEND